MPNTRIFLIRHGQSEWNALGKWQGQADPPLTDLGREQAERAAALVPTEVEAWVCSPLLRAEETAAILAKATGKSTPQAEPLLKERSAGEFEGLTKDQIEELFPGYLGDRRFPQGWEDDAELQVRVEQGLRSIAQQFPGQCVAAVSHGGVIRMLVESRGQTIATIANLAALWIEVSATGEIELGARTDLLPVSEQTVPGQI